MSSNHKTAEQSDLHHKACPAEFQSDALDKPEPVTDTASLSGLRLIFNFSVVILHTVLFLALALPRPTDATKLVEGSIPSYLLSVIITLGIVSVDVFFLISGFILKSTFSNTNPTLSSSIFYILFRYLRLVPAYLVIAFLLHAAHAPNCSNLSALFLLNLGDARKYCVGVAWSTQVDFVSHVLLLPLLQYPRILAMILLLTPPLRMFKWFERGKPYHPTPPIVTDFIDTPKQLADARKLLGLQPGNYTLTDFDIHHRRSMVDAYYPLYFGLPYRIAAIVIGVLTFSCMKNKTGIYQTVRKFPSLSLACMTLVWAFFYSAENFVLASPLVQLIHQSIGRISFTMAMSVVIMLTCSVEDTRSDHWVSRGLRGFLTCRPVAFLQQFSYVVYLLHTFTAPVLVLLPPKFTMDRFSAWWVLLLGSKLYLITLLIGLPVWGFECLSLRGRAWLRGKISGVRWSTEKSKKDI